MALKYWLFRDMPFILVLMLSCWLVPGIVYVLALTFFGVPHVLWEMAWVRRTIGTAIPRWWWRALGCGLTVLVLGRVGALFQLIEPKLTAKLDLVSLMMAIACVLGLSVRTNWWVKLLLWIAMLSLISAIWYVINSQDFTLTLVLLTCLSIAHNFTPIGLVQFKPHTKEGAQDWSMLVLLFALPLLLLIVPPPLALLNKYDLAIRLPSESLLLASHFPRFAHGLAACLVLAQCMHYLSIIRYFPRLKPVWLSPTSKMVAVTISVTSSLLFLCNFTETRRVYSVASGVHAWLEWPLLFILIYGLAGRQRNNGSVE